MNAPRARWSRYLYFSALLVAALVAIPMIAVSIRKHIATQAVSSQQQAAVEARNKIAVDALRKAGASVVLGLSGSPGDVVSIDLSRVPRTSEAWQLLAGFPGVERLTLDNAKLSAEDSVVLSKLTRLQSLSLVRSDATDAHLEALPLGLKKLTLDGTAITDRSMTRVALMEGLTELSMTDTQVTADGLRKLEPLRSLAELHVSESCITADSVNALRIMQPKRVDVTVPDGLGRTTYDLLSVCDGGEIWGRHRDGPVLWEAHRPWNETLAGVVEAVVTEVDLNSEQAAKLFEMLGTRPPEAWNPDIEAPLVPFRAFSIRSADSMEQKINSPDEFIQHLRKSQVSLSEAAVRQYGRDKFSRQDVPKLLAALRKTEPAPFPDCQGLFLYGPFLLVQHGSGDPAVLAELERLLMHKDGLVRMNTISAFGLGGALPFYAPDEWTPNEAADIWVFPRLLRMLKDPKGENPSRRLLTEIALRRPQFAAALIPEHIELLAHDGEWQMKEGSLSQPISTVDLPRLAKLAPEAAVAAIPRLRKILGGLEAQIPGEPSEIYDGFSPMRQLQARSFAALKVLAAFAHYDPALAHEVAIDFERRLEKRQIVPPFAPLLSPETPETTRLVVLALLRHPDVGVAELMVVSKRIRDWDAGHRPKKGTSKN